MKFPVLLVRCDDNIEAPTYAQFGVYDHLLEASCQCSSVFLMGASCTIPYDAGQSPIPLRRRTISARHPSSGCGSCRRNTSTLRTCNPPRTARNYLPSLFVAGTRANCLKSWVLEQQHNCSCMLPKCPISFLGRRRSPNTCGSHLQSGGRTLLRVRCSH